MIRCKGQASPVLSQKWKRIEETLFFKNTKTLVKIKHSADKIFITSFNMKKLLVSSDNSFGICLQFACEICNSEQWS